MLQEWLSRPHVQEWWDDRTPLADLEADYAPVIRGTPGESAYIALLENEPVGFIQVYTPALAHEDGWWLDEHDLRVRGIDQFIADGSRLNQGLGTAMIGAFIAKLLQDPTVTRIQTDPSPKNARAIRCYEKAGFYPAKVIDTPDGPALLMYRDRSAATE